jgi:uncharacterized protein YutE (UPF0331/DUF86 family)
VTSADVANKAAFVREALEELAAIPHDSVEEFRADRRNLPAALHWLQTAIQALIDIGLILVSQRGLPVPRTSIDVLERLEEAKCLPPGSAARFRPVIGFRNRVVHLYDRVDAEIVHRVVAEDRNDLADLLALLLDASSAPN